MIVSIEKEEGDRILTDFLVEASKANGTKECAEESYKIMNNLDDSQLVISIIIREIAKQSKHFPKEVTEFEVKIMSALASFFSTFDKPEVPHQFKELFCETTKTDLARNLYTNKKLIFAVQNFVNAFYRFDCFEKKYPEITKML